MNRFFRILEYLSREDADRALRDLDNKDLRGKVVRVALDESGVSFWTFLSALNHAHARYSAPEV